jgi:hypothetical protein
MHAIQLMLLNSQLSNSHCRLKKFDAETIYQIQLPKGHLET